MAFCSCLSLSAITLLSSWILWRWSDCFFLRGSTSLRASSLSFCYKEWSSTQTMRRLCVCAWWNLSVDICACFTTALTNCNFSFLNRSRSSRRCMLRSASSLFLINSCSSFSVCTTVLNYDQKGIGTKLLCMHVYVCVYECVCICDM